MLLARIYAVFPLVCPHCGGAMRIIAFITDPAAGTGERDPHAQPAPEYAFDQRIAW